jgi:sporulation protein YlmC with PRC-barrel domain
MATIDAPQDPSGRLISADRVQGTAVYDPAGEKLGSVRELMIDKQSGRIAYAILSFGGFLGVGDRSHPMPWQTLRYDTELGGYVVDLDRSVLEGAPAYAADQSAALDDESFARNVDSHYGVESLWGSLA